MFKLKIGCIERNNYLLKNKFKLMIMKIRWINEIIIEKIYFSIFFFFYKKEDLSGEFKIYIYKFGKEDRI